MAEMIFKQLTNGKYATQSAGTEAMGSDGTNLEGMLLKNRASSKYVIESLREIGIDASNNTIKKLTPKMVAEADKIIVMVKPDQTSELLRKSDKVTYWDIADPDEQTLEYHRQTRDKIKKCLKI